MQNKPSFEGRIEDFLAQKRIAVAGVSRSGTEAANTIFRKLRDSGYAVFPVNPGTRTVEGVDCYPSLGAIPGGVDAVVISTHPAVTVSLVQDCVELGIRHVWIHRSFGQGSVSQPALDLCREEEIQAIPGGCPMMFLSPVDVPHRCMRWVLRLTGGLPRAA